MNSNEIIETLYEWGKIAHNEDNRFINIFCPNAWILTEVSWDCSRVRFVYILECGQHVSDSAPISKWLDFIQNFNN